MLRIVLVAVVTLGLLGPAHAAPGTEGWLAWSSSSGLCGDAGTFAARVERALGRSPARAAAEAHVNVIAHVVGSAATGASGWVGEVHLRGDDQRDLGSRTIDRRDASCQPLVDALAVVTALALADDGIVPSEAAASADQGLLAGSPPAPEAPPAPASFGPDTPVAVPAPASAARAPASRDPVPLPSRTEPSIEAQAQAPARAPRSWRSGIEAGPTVAIGLLPRAALGAEVSAYLRPASGWKLFLVFDGWQRQTKLDDQGRGASFQRLTVGLGLCPVTVTRGRWDGAACLGGNVGRLSVSGVGLPTSSTQDRLTLDAGLGVELTRRLVGPMAVGLTVGVTAPLVRDRISYATTDGTVVSIFRESPVAAIGAFRASFVF